MGLGFVKHFNVKSHFTCIDEASSSCKSFCNSNEVSRVMSGKKDYISIKVNGVKIRKQK
jgi:hypothetical protein